MQIKNPYAHVEDVVLSLKNKIDQVLQPLIPKGVPCALLDFPDYSNPGDSAIWLGQTKWLRRNNNSIVYVCDRQSYSAESLSEVIDNGIILLQGGGNFGDLWVAHQDFREQVIRDFAFNKIIQLPQTIFFKEQKALELSRNTLNRHADLTLLCRDTQSLELARKEFSATSILCPDMAFAMGPLKRPSPAETDILWLSRKDKESSKNPLPYNVPGVVVTDWLDEPRKNSLATIEELQDKLAPDVKEQSQLFFCLLEAYDAIAEERLLRGCKTLARGNVVITDRLHAHILSILLGIPHILLDNNYGKIKGFYDAWTNGSPLARWAGAADKIGENLFSTADYNELAVSHNVAVVPLKNLLKRLANLEEAAIAQKQTWMTAASKTEQELLSMVCEGESVILVDEEHLRSDITLSNISIMPFLEKDQQYAGLPPNDDTAIKEIERLRSLNASFIAFAWPTFWWLNYYPYFFNYLRSRFHCCLENERLIIFNLKNYKV